MSVDLSHTLTFPNGISLSNRIVKSSTEELLADADAGISDELLQLYQIWSESGAGLILTGNMFISPQAIGRRGNAVISSSPLFRQRLATLASIMKQHGSKALVQLNHAGRQALRQTRRQPVAPSAVPIKGFGPLFVMPRPLRDDEIEQIIAQFVEAAHIVWDAGFDGVEIHAAHGYLLSQFLSPLTNRREDRWGGTLNHRATCLLEIVRRVRAGLPRELVLGVKINSADFQRGGFEEGEALEVIKLLNKVQLDFIEISGGNYESPAMAGRHLASTESREAYFLDFAQAARQATDIPLILTGGFRSAQGMNQALAEGSVDLIGIARPIILEPGFPKRLLNEPGARAWLARDKIGIKKLDDMLQTFWYKRHIRAIATKGRSLGPNAGRLAALFLELPRAVF